MVQFHETRMGQAFYSAQVPDLIKALEKIGSSLEQASEKKACHTVSLEVTKANTANIQQLMDEGAVAKSIVECDGKFFIQFEAKNK